jgi:hypothetical protein
LMLQTFYLHGVKTQKPIKAYDVKSKLVQVHIQLAKKWSLWSVGNFVPILVSVCKFELTLLGLTKFIGGTSHVTRHTNILCP